MTSTRTRTRLTPAARQDQLLDTARAMIMEQGLQSFTMEGLAKAAAVSAPLVYNYFPNRQDLLQALLKREYRRYVDNIVQASGAAKDFKDLVRVAVTSNFDHQAPGNLLPMLLSQPEISVAVRKEQMRDRRKSATFLVRRTAKQYRLTQREAQLVISMASGASIAAAELSKNANLYREDAIDSAINFIMAGIERIARPSAAPE
ncbi:MAG: TetR/AcrR family transcriptional regulator [Pseudomonadales bacterium]